MTQPARTLKDYGHVSYLLELRVYGSSVPQDAAKVTLNTSEFMLTDIGHHTNSPKDIRRGP
jgi:hypothetical protein